jgi:mRNA interferase HigB
MRIISKRTLRAFCAVPQFSNAKSALEAWYEEVSKATWNTPQDIKAKYRSASILKNNRVVFNIAGNKYRLIVSVDYVRQACFVKFIGTHEQYDAIDAEVYDVYSTH